MKLRTWFLLSIWLIPHLSEAIDLVSINAAGTNSGSRTSGGFFSPDQITPDGRFVVFRSSANDLVATDSNGTTDVFVRDLQADITTLVSINATGTDSGNGFSEPTSDPQITPDGQFVVFKSEASDLVVNDRNGQRDLFVRNLQAGITTLVSINATGTNSGNGDSSSPRITSDGQFVFFVSSASDLVINDRNGQEDLFVRDLQAGITTLVSINATGTNSGNGFSIHPKITPNGRFVVFDSSASDLVITDSNGTTDVFVRDLQAGITTLVSVNATGTDSGNSFSSGSLPPNQITFDGRFVVFRSSASDLVANDSNGGIGDIFVRDLQMGTTTLVSVNQAGTGSGNGPSSDPQITPDGRFVVFRSSASDLVTMDSNGLRDIFVRDLRANTTTLASINVSDTDSGNGNSGGDFSFTWITSDGRFVAFASSASDLVANDSNGSQDIFIRDLQAGTTTLVSIDATSTDSGNGNSSDPQITPDGRFVVFRSGASDLVAMDNNGQADVFRFFNENADSVIRLDFIPIPALHFWGLLWLSSFLAIFGIRRLYAKK